MNEVAELLRREVLRSMPDRRPVYEWAAERVDFGRRTAFKGKYDIANVPWTRPFLDACADPVVREVTFVGPPQVSGKTKAAEVYLAWRVMTSPTNASFNTTTNIKAEQWSETRWEAMLKSVAGMSDRFSLNKHEKKKRRILFRDGTFLLIQGAETEGNRASDSVELAINDEVYLWDAPWLKEIYGRTDAYRETRKLINVSVGGLVGGELHQRFLAGNRLEWMHLCPDCGKPFAYVFDHEREDCNIRFDLRSAIVHADGSLDLREFAETIRVNCPACKFSTGYNVDLLRRLNANGVAVARNPGAPREIVSLHVNAFAIGREPWVEILEPWVRMNIRGGVFAPELLREFITKPLAEFWSPKPYAVTKELALAPWARAEMTTPGRWEKELFRVFCVDNQHGRKGDTEHRWFAAVAISRDGFLRVFDCGRINEWEEVDKRRRALGIPDPTLEKPGPWVTVDRRYDLVGVDEICARKRWYGVMGSKLDEFVHPAWSDFAGSRKIFSEMRSIDVSFGTAETGRAVAHYFLFSSQRAQTLLSKLRNAGRIEFAADTLGFCPEIATHMNSHQSVVHTDKYNNRKTVWVQIGDTPDHVYDCVTQAVILAAIAGVLGTLPDDLLTPQ